jgi:hypothetical protein
MNNSWHGWHVQGYDGLLILDIHRIKPEPIEFIIPLLDLFTLSKLTSGICLINTLLPRVNISNEQMMAIFR